MKKLIFVLTLVIPIIVSAQSKDEKEVRALFDECVKAWNAGDLDRYMDIYDKGDSTLFMNRTVIAYGWNDSYETFKKAFPDKPSMGQLKLVIKVARRLSPTCWLVIGSFQVERAQGNFGGNFSDVVQKINKEWKVVVDHS